MSSNLNISTYPIFFGLSSILSTNVLTELGCIKIWPVNLVLLLIRVFYKILLFPKQPRSSHCPPTLWLPIPKEGFLCRYIVLMKQNVLIIDKSLMLINFPLNWSTIIVYISIVHDYIPPAFFYYILLFPFPLPNTDPHLRTKCVCKSLYVLKGFCSLLYWMP